MPQPIESVAIVGAGNMGSGIAQKTAQEMFQVQMVDREEQWVERGQSIQEKGGGRRLIDSISSLLISFDLGTVQRFLNQIARTGIAFGGVTTLFVLEEGTVDETLLNNVKYIMDGVIEFKRDDTNHQCRVSSMKWAKSNPAWVKCSHQHS